MTVVNNIINQKFNRLLVLSRDKSDSNGRAKWLCVCDCGNYLSVFGKSLVSNNTRSCGCLQKEKATKILTNLNKIQKGSNHPSYNPNLSDNERIERRHVPEWLKWRNAVIQRDNNTCQLCGTKRKIISHHLDGYHWCKERRFDINNGVSLCYWCHTKFHKIYGFRNNTENQFLEFRKGILCQEKL